MRNFLWMILWLFSVNLWANCLLLGKNPSFIVQLQSNQVPESVLLQQFSSTKFKLQDVRSMRDWRYIFVFQALPKNARETGPCYSKEFVNELEQELLKQEMVADVMPNLMLKPMTTINLMQWNLLTAPGGIEVAPAWNLLRHRGKADVTIAILDTGILDHVALNPNLLAAVYQKQQFVWKRYPEMGEDAGVSFTDNGQFWGLGAAPSCKKCSSAAHGTHVAGIIAASGQLAYGEQVYGVAPGTSILPINVFSKIDDPEVCDGYKNTPCSISYTADQLNAQAWLEGKNFPGLPVAPKVSAMNLSIGGFGDCPRIAQESFRRLLNKKMSIIVAAGNSNIDATQIYPAGCPQVISVAATGPSGERAWYSNWGKRVTVAAPGGNSINSMYQAPQNQIYSTIGQAYKFLQGTSMAAPMVSGVVALMYAIEANLTQARVLELLTRPENLTAFPQASDLRPELISCINRDNPEQSCGVGIINAHKVVRAMLATKVES